MKFCAIVLEIKCTENAQLKKYNKALKLFGKVILQKMSKILLFRYFAGNTLRSPMYIFMECTDSKLQNIQEITKTSILKFFAKD